MNTYDKVVNQFIQVLTQPLEKVHQSPRSLGRACGIPASTSYRVIKALEKSNYLKRDSSGLFVKGPATLSLALSACGYGDLATVAFPVLERLRREAGATALLGYQDKADFYITAFSFAQGVDYQIPEQNMHLRLTKTGTYGDVDVFLLQDKQAWDMESVQLEMVSKPHPLASQDCYLHVAILLDNPHTQMNSMRVIAIENAAQRLFENEGTHQ